MLKEDLRFNSFLKNVEKSYYKEIRKQIIVMCKISKSCYYKWISGRATPSPARRSIINGVAVKFGYSPVYPNNKIKKLQTSIMLNYASK